MASPIYAYYRAWNVSTNVGQPTDSANHTLVWSKDGVESSITNAPAPTGQAGVYKVLLTAAETNCHEGIILGTSSTANVVIFGTQYLFPEFTSAMQQILLQTAVGTTKNVYFVSSAGSDANTGLSVSQAFASISKAASVAVAGDAILFDGTINEATSSARRIEIPAGVILRGASRATAIINVAWNTADDDAGYTCFYAGNNCSLENFTIVGTATSTKFQLMFGYSTSQTPSSGVAVRNVRVVGNSDAGYFNSSDVGTGFWRFYDCVLESRFDSHTILGSNTDQQVEYFNCEFTAVAPSSVSSSFVGTRAVTCTNGVTRLYNCAIRAETTSTATVHTQCVYARTSGTSGRIELYGCSMATKVPSAGYTGDDYHLHADASATLIMHECTFDAAKVSGTLLYAGVADKLNSTLETGASSGLFRFSEPALVNAPAADVFQGANTVTLTVRDDSDLIVPGAWVRITQGALTQAKQANGSAVISISLDDGDFVLTASKGGYSSVPQTISVDSTHTSFDVDMIVEVLPVATDPAQSRGSLRCYDQQGNPDPSAKVTIQQMDAGTTGSWPLNMLTVDCDADGDIIDPTEPDHPKGVLHARGVRYRARRGTDLSDARVVWVYYTVPDDASFTLPAMLGID